MTELLVLLMAHHLGDIYQPSWLIENKKKHAWSIWEHVMCYTAFMSVALYIIGMFQIWMVLYFIIGHFIIDSFFYLVLPKLRNEPKQFWYTYPDQALHYAQILLLCVII